MTQSTSDRSLARTVVVRTVQVVIAIGLATVVGLFVWDNLLAKSDDTAKPATSERGGGDAGRDVDWRQIGDRAYANRQWDKAAEAYRHILERHPDNLPALVRLAYSLHSAGRLDEALVADVRASRSPYARSWALYNIACVYAVKQERELALDYLRQAIEAGFRSERPLREDPDFASLIDDPEFQQLEQLAKPLQMRGVYRRMDFLVGRWMLVEKEKERSGRFTLQHDAGGYGLSGDFQNTALPMIAAVTAYYDPANEKWRQIWLDNHGGVIDLMESSASSSVFVLDGQWIKPNGDRNPTRLTFTVDDDQSIMMVLTESRDSRMTWDTVVKTKLLRMSDEATARNKDEVETRK